MPDSLDTSMLIVEAVTDAADCAAARRCARFIDVGLLGSARRRRRSRTPAGGAPRRRW